MTATYHLKGIFSGISIIFAVAMLSSCGGGLPKEVKNRAKAVPGAIESQKSQVDKQTKKYDRLTQSPDFNHVKTFAAKENWKKNFQLAHAELDRAKTIYDKDLVPLIKKNRLESSPLVQQQLLRINKVIREAEAFSQYPFIRYSKINDTIKNMDALNAKAKKDAKGIAQVVSSLKTGVLAKAETDFPDLTQTLNKKFSPLLNLERQSRNYLNAVVSEYSRHSSGAPADYAGFTDNSESLSSGFKEAGNLEKGFKDDVGQLYLSYTKILKDMKEEYYVNIKRESWNENSDFYNPEFASFQRQVSPEAYAVLTSDSIDAIATIAAGFTGSRFKNNISSTIWDELHINPAERWPGRGHNAASFWVESSSEAYFHKYILEKDGETEETGWKKVDPSFYDANSEFLGMAILSKPYGVFEQDRLTQAAPPGMSYVGNPQYGEWKKDDSGDRFWSWYGKYAFFSSLFFFPPTYYYYNSWYGWHNNYRYRKPYFGKTKKGFQKYGTYGTMIKKSPKFQSTSFAKSGGFKSQTASVRGAGANLRGGGPKSKGK